MPGSCSIKGFARDITKAGDKVVDVVLVAHGGYLHYTRRTRRAWARWRA
jgi:crotonobetainyl-CoA:carnitine CoA-transferase CaiB-like acyl-CoA transferase